MQKQCPAVKARTQCPGVGRRGGVEARRPQAKSARNGCRAPAGGRPARWPRMNTLHRAAALPTVHRGRGVQSFSFGFRLVRAHSVLPGVLLFSRHMLSGTTHAYHTHSCITLTVCARSTERPAGQRVRRLFGHGASLRERRAAVGSPSAWAGRLALRLPGPLRPRWADAMREACVELGLPVPREAYSGAGPRGGRRAAHEVRSCGAGR